MPQRERGARRLEPELADSRRPDVESGYKGLGERGSLGGSGKKRPRSVGKPRGGTGRRSQEWPDCPLGDLTLGSETQDSAPSGLSAGEAGEVHSHQRSLRGSR